MNIALVHSMISDMEEHISAVGDIGQLLVAVSSSRCHMPCSASAPLANMLLEHADKLSKAFNDLHRMTREGAPCA